MISSRNLYEGRLMIELKKYTDMIRNDDGLVGTDGVCGKSCDGIYPSPKTGTTAFCKPDQDGVYEKPVYYDWGKNWDRVREIVPTAEVQAVMKKCLKEVGSGYYHYEYDPKTIWPWLSQDFRRHGNGEQDDLLNYYLPTQTIRRLNAEMADYIQAKGERWIKKNYGKEFAEQAASDDDSDEDISDDVLGEVIFMIWEPFSEYLIQWVYDHKTFHEKCEKLLYDPDRPDGIREKLIMYLGDSYSFMPLYYKLADILSPSNADLRVLVSNEYSVVYDAAHNVLYDPFWYFCEVPPEETLAKAQLKPQQSPDKFDYTLGGLIDEKQKCQRKRNY